MDITCIADLHGFYPELEGGDLLIVAGDLTARDDILQYKYFNRWIGNQIYKKKVVICGNHDMFLERCVRPAYKYLNKATYLCDSGTEFEGLKIWGSPWTLTFPGINPHCTAFTGTEEDLKAKFDLIPDDIDILVTHGPPYGILDMVYDRSLEALKSVGSKSLSRRILGLSSPWISKKPKFHIFGHIHEGYDSCVHEGRNYINCSHVNERYEPVNKPVRIIL